MGLHTGSASYPGRTLDEHLTPLRLGFLVCPIRRVAPHLHANGTLGKTKDKACTRVHQLSSLHRDTGGGAGSWEESQAFRLSPAFAPLG